MKLENLNIDKSKLVLADRTKEYQDDIISTKPISYYKDAWLRFKRNKAALVASVLLGIILFFTIFGPHMKKYDLPNQDKIVANYFRELPPKIPGLEKIGIFNGNKTIKGRNKEFIDSLPEGIVVRVVDERVVDGTVLQDVVVDYYKYHSYIQSYGDQLVNGKPDIQTRRLNKEEYELALEKNAVIQLVNYHHDQGIYETQIDLYRFALDSKAEDVYFWFGTNSQGEDVFTNLWKASRISLLLATIITVINMVIGLILGSIMGYFGGTLDILFERFVEILNNLPFMVILTLLVLRYGTGFGVIIFAFVFNGWIGFYGTTRIQFYRYKNRDYVLAARSLGAKDARIIYKHIFPNAIGTLITSFSLAIPRFIFTESVFSFLGIINYASSTSVGRMLSEGQDKMNQHFHLILFPAIFISILMLSFNLISNGLRDAFNPSLRGVEE
ncbi:MAG: ABC transporter permease [Bacilli bacterium]|jgi:oligopeptide transport system permease protein